METLATGSSRGRCALGATAIHVPTEGSVCSGCLSRSVTTVRVLLHPSPLLLASPCAGASAAAAFSSASARARFPLQAAATTMPQTCSRRASRPPSASGGSCARACARHPFTAAWDITPRSSASKFRSSSSVGFCSLLLLAAGSWRSFSPSLSLSRPSAAAPFSARQALARRPAKSLPLSSPRCSASSRFLASTSLNRPSAAALVSKLEALACTASSRPLASASGSRPSLAAAVKRLRALALEWRGSGSSGWASSLFLATASLRLPPTAAPASRLKALAWTSFELLRGSLA
mmetsp:Transcript_42734/g.123602  ORF Transcript_42734/g.123602 Transcript_42734/m.123602 type:complete len:291 (-) Transcript_42734:1070-1942(-)